MEFKISTFTRFVEQIASDRKKEGLLTSSKYQKDDLPFWDVTSMSVRSLRFATDIPKALLLSPFISIDDDFFFSFLFSRREREEKGTGISSQRANSDPISTMVNGVYSRV